jgi:hypothetical protein
MASKTVSDTLDQVIKNLRAAHGENLSSIVLYGSAAAGDHVESRSDHNLLIALTRITTRDLHAANSAMREWEKLGQPIPVYFTVAELQDAADVFPIEFHQMEKGAQGFVRPRSVRVCADFARQPPPSNRVRTADEADSAAPALYAASASLPRCRPC